MAVQSRWKRRGRALCNRSSSRRPFIILIHFIFHKKRLQSVCIYAFHAAMGVIKCSSDD